MEKQAKIPKLEIGKLVIGVLTLTTLLSGTILASTKAKANTDTTVVDEVTVIIPTACSLSGSIASGDQHTATVLPGSYTPNIGKTNLKALCNDFNGFSIYAIGYSNDTEGTTDMIGTSGATIATDTATTGDTSNWAMKLTKVSDPTKTYNPNNLNITTGYDAYHAVPNTWTKVASYATGSSETSSATDQTLGANIETTYAVLVSGAQAADTYTGKVKYLLVHPASVESVSDAITVNFTIPDGSDMSFAGGATTNTVKFRQLCEDPNNNSSTCQFAITEGEYEQPTGYKGAWTVTIAGDSIVYPIENAEQWIIRLTQMGGENFLGQTLTVPAYDGNAIVYDGNGATAGDMSHVASRFTMVYENNELPYDSNSTTLIAPNFYKSGYGFAGWSTDSSATASSNNVYGPNATITKSNVSFDSDGTDTLYAVWVQSTGNMQSFSCSSLSNEEDITALTDTRDGNVYTVGKLLDGNCWMMENLRLDGNIALNSTNTNNPAISSLGASQDNWCTNDNAACINQSIINTNNTNMDGVNASGAPLMTSYYMGGEKVQWYGYGNYYNWYAATAGNGTYATTSGNAAGDICPAGWSLPTGGSGGQFAALNTAVNSDSTSDSTGLRAYPANFVYSGYWDEVSANDRSDYGGYWSRTARNSNTAHYLYFASNGVSPENYWNKYRGFTARCVQSGS